MADGQNDLYPDVPVVAGALYLIYLVYVSIILLLIITIKHVNVLKTQLTISTIGGGGVDGLPTSLLSQNDS